MCGLHGWHMTALTLGMATGVLGIISDIWHGLKSKTPASAVTLWPSQDRLSPMPGSVFRRADRCSLFHRLNSNWIHGLATHVRAAYPSENGGYAARDRCLWAWPSAALS